MARVDWYFPNVEAGQSELAEPVEIVPVVSRTARWSNLLPETVLSLGLAEVTDLVGSFRAALRPTAKHGWAVAPHPGGLSGPSAQLAAALSLLSQCAGAGVVRSLEASAVEEVWATAALFRDDIAGIRIRRVGGPVEHDAQAFRAKLEAFGRSSGQLFICSAHDSATQEKLPAALIRLDDFPAWLEHSTRVRTILALEPVDFVRAASLLLPGLVPSTQVDATVLVTDSSQGSDAIREAIREDASTLFHAQFDARGAVLAFKSPDDAFGLACVLLRRNIRVAAALHLGKVTYDGASVAGPVVDQVRDLVVAVRARRGAYVTEDVVELLAKPPTGHLLSLSSFSQKPVYDVTPGQHPYPVIVGRRGFSQSAARVALALTLSRVPLGLLAGTLFMVGHSAAGLIVYVTGLMTDVLDGFIARSWNGVTARGKSLDGITDMVFNLCSGLGFLVGALVFWRAPRISIYILLSSVALMLGSRYWVPPGSRAAKARSGVIRVIIIAAIAPMLPPEARLAVVGLAPFLILAAMYEIAVMMKDEEYGNTQGWFGAPPAGLERPDQALQRRILQKLGLVRRSPKDPT